MKTVQSIWKDLLEQEDDEDQEEPEDEVPAGEEPGGVVDPAPKTIDDKIEQIQTRIANSQYFHQRDIDRLQDMLELLQIKKDKQG